MHTENSHRCDNWIYKVFFNKEEGEGRGYQISDMRMGDLQVVEEEQNIYWQKNLC